MKINNSYNNIYFLLNKNSSDYKNKTLLMFFVTVDYVSRLCLISAFIVQSKPSGYFILLGIDFLVSIFVGLKYSDQVPLPETFYEFVFTYRSKEDFIFDDFVNTPFINARDAYRFIYLVFLTIYNMSSDQSALFNDNLARNVWIVGSFCAVSLLTYFLFRVLFVRKSDADLVKKITKLESDGKKMNTQLK